MLSTRDVTLEVGQKVYRRSSEGRRYSLIGPYTITRIWENSQSAARGPRKYTRVDLIGPLEAVKNVGPGEIIPAEWVKE